MGKRVALKARPREEGVSLLLLAEQDVAFHGVGVKERSINLSPRGQLHLSNKADIHRRMRNTTL